MATVKCGSRHQRGFTLVELMIVVAILAVVVTIALPAVSDYLKKSRRSDGRAILMQIAGKQEQYFLNNRSYTQDFTELGDLTASAVSAASVTSEKGYYSVTLVVDREVAGRIYEYTLNATPIGAQRGDDCKTLTLNQVGDKDFTPSTAGHCW